MVVNHLLNSASLLIHTVVPLLHELRPLGKLSLRDGVRDELGLEFRVEVGLELGLERVRGK